VSAYDKALTLEPDNLTIWAQKKNVLKSLGRHEEVIDASQRILEKEPNDPEALRDKAEALEYLDRYEEAIELYDQVLRLNSKDAPALHRKGRALSKMGLDEEALECIDNALKLDTKNERLWNDKGILLAKMEDYQNAISSFESALKLDSTDDNVWTNKGLAHYESEMYDEALKSFDKAIEINKSNAQALKGKGKTLIARDEFESAIRCYDRVVEIMPQEIGPWISKAEAYVSIGRFEAAIGCYDRAIDLDKGNKSLWINKGMLLDRIRKYEDAISCYDSALDIDDRDGNLWHRKGMALVKIGDLDGAIGCYDRALGLNPDSKAIWASKGNALNNMENHEQALRCFEHALQLDPKFTPAVEGKERAEREIKKRNMERYAKEILKFERDYHRAPTKEEAFRVCHIPYNYLDSVIEHLSKKEDVDINALSFEERDKFEMDSNRAILSALREDPASFEKHGLKLSDIVTGFPEYNISKAKRLLAYITKVDEMDVKVDEMTPELEETLHRALELPPYRRNLTGLIQDLHMGIYEAKRVNSLLSTFHEEEVLTTPEVRVRSLGEEYISERPVEGTFDKPLEYAKTVDTEEAEVEEALCLICDKNPVDVSHKCGAKLCNECLYEYNNRYAKLYETEGEELVCPKCGGEIVKPRKKRPRKEGEEEFVRL
jgi:tetratricopeptide (TPR) repeat protein